MLIEVAVFGRQQGIHQQIGEAAALHEQALLAVRRLQHGDKTRIEAEETELAVIIHILDGLKMVAVEGKTRAHLPFLTVREIERTTDHLDAVSLHGIFAGARHRADLAILRGVEQTHHLVFADLHVRLKVDHPAIDRGRQLPDFTVNAAADFLVEVDAIGGNQHREDNPQLDQQPQPAALPTRLATFAFGFGFSRHRFLILIIIVIILVVVVLFPDPATGDFLFSRT